MLCEKCGKQSAPEDRYCSACGARLAGHGAEVPEVRKTVTAVFSDLVGSTALGEQVDPELFRSLTGRYYEEMRRATENHGGLVLRFVGDAVLAVFGLTATREDDALRAVRAASEMKARLLGLNRELAEYQ